MLSAIGAKALGSIVAMIVGGVVAAVTVFGFVSSQVNSAGDHPGNANSPLIDYGSNG